MACCLWLSWCESDPFFTPKLLSMKNDGWLAANGESGAAQHGQPSLTRCGAGRGGGRRRAVDNNGVRVWRRETALVTKLGEGHPTEAIPRWLGGSPRSLPRGLT
ncbi:hypothetical protein GUJ93_ZPchr0001g31094 [Zizania palustris]|uniref:Uncharacterized protein n=1 Tax=Zizania palustris TaxID=103762 RepID=A0A8J5RAN0_ZIZPA|nr:hypothetical protein GUJ93_ZPchr0001g31094 [Zizania palustris]